MPRRRLPVILVAVALAVIAVSCSSGEESSDDAGVFESERTRPTDQAEHDHSGEASALAPETVLAEEIAELGDGVAQGESMELWVGVNICGRFVNLPIDAGATNPGASGASGGFSLDETGLLTVAPGPGDPTGHDVTVADIAEFLDLEVSTGQLVFGPSWDGQSVGEQEDSVSLGGASFLTADECELGPETERAEVQLWYYTPQAVVSGEQVRMVVTDPETTPVVEDGSAVTVAFAPVSSLPTLPPAALVG